MNEKNVKRFHFSGSFVFYQSELITMVILEDTRTMLENENSNDLVGWYIYLIPFKFRLPLMFASKGAKIGGSEF